MERKNQKPKRIGIDARFFGPQNKGLGRYCQKLVEYLELVDGGNNEREYYVLLKKENFDLYEPQYHNFKKIKADFHWYTLKEQFLFNGFLNKLNFDLVHFCHFNVPLFYRKKFLVTIHDLILFHYPTKKNTTLNKYFYFLKLAAYRAVIQSAARRAIKIIAVSKYTKKDIIEYLRVDKAKITMIYEGCDFFCHRSIEGDDEILKKYGIMKPYLLYVGNAYPHKNLERLVLSYNRIRKRRPELSLVLVGKKDFFYQRVEKYVQKKSVKNVIFPGYVKDVDLDVLFKEARLYVFPSLYEGFGLPPLEALMKGTPVTSSDRTSMPEILKDLVLYFDPEKIDSIKKGIEKALSEKNKILDMSKVVKVAGAYNWEKMAQQTRDCYKGCLKS